MLENEPKSSSESIASIDIAERSVAFLLGAAGLTIGGTVAGDLNGMVVADLGVGAFGEASVAGDPNGLCILATDLGVGAFSESGKVTLVSLL